MVNQVDKTIERIMYPHDAVEPPVSCPQCRQTLVQESGPYLIATRRDRRKTDSLMVNGKFGHGSKPSHSTFTIE